ncbi:hypothetical protein HZS_7403 [Henneguya salminicola]|nr:hypothetical protein HZS_7403 [Henneguya salminicola]
MASGPGNNDVSNKKSFFPTKPNKKLTEQLEETTDTAETVHISALALLKMLKHGRAGVPLEVMGLMLGEFIDEYTVHVVDVFAMPQTALGVSVEAIDYVFQTKMLYMLKRTGRDECVVGWYHSHPGFGCWLSNVDCQTQNSFENLHRRAVAVVVDPIQSVKGKVIIDAFRCINSMSILGSSDVRSVTSNLGHLRRAPILMLKNLNKQNWMKGLCPNDYEKHSDQNLKSLDKMNSLLKLYETFGKQESELAPEVFSLLNVGRKDPRKHLNDIAAVLLRNNITQPLRGLVSTLSF